MSNELLIEQVVSAYRERSLDGQLAASPAWHDLEDAERQVAFDITLRQRRLERALDPQKLSTTARAVLSRISGS